MQPPADVDAHPQGISPFGVADMVGNIWQWTDEFADLHTRTAILRGGSHYQPQGFCLVFPAGLPTDAAREVSPHVTEPRSIGRNRISVRKPTPWARKGIIHVGQFLRLAFQYPRQHGIPDVDVVRSPGSDRAYPRYRRAVDRRL